MESVFGELMRTSPLLALALFGLVAGLAYYWLTALLLAREGIRHALRTLLYTLATGYLCVLGLWLMSDARHASSGGLVIFVAGGALLIFSLRALNRTPQSRKRYIPRSVRRAVIARDLKGEKFDPRKHHMDHVWPFSKGGSHTVDNLRVIAKARNLKKGAKRPTLRDLW
jgi:hypothetical protein